MKEEWGVSTSLDATSQKRLKNELRKETECKKVDSAMQHGQTTSAKAFTNVHCSDG